MRFITKKEVVLPTRSTSSHKRDNGVVLSVGGSEEYVGALGLASLAALRSGCDLSIVCAPEKVAWALHCYSLDLITIKLSGNILSSSHEKTISKAAEKADVLLLGNGAGVAPQTKTLLANISRKNKGFKVIDADGIKAVDLRKIQNSILTPHAKELEMLFKNSRLNYKEVQKESDFEKKSKVIQLITKKYLENNNIVILKGPVDGVITDKRIFYNKTGNASMTKGGTGDVLAGLCAGYLAQSKNMLQSALNGVWMTGMIGDHLYKKKKNNYLASDMIEEIRTLNRFFRRH